MMIDLPTASELAAWRQRLTDAVRWHEMQRRRLRRALLYLDRLAALTGEEPPPQRELREVRHIVRTTPLVIRDSILRDQILRILGRVGHPLGMVDLAETMAPDFGVSLNDAEGYRALRQRISSVLHRMKDRALIKVDGVGGRARWTLAPGVAEPAPGAADAIGRDREEWVGVDPTAWHGGWRPPPRRSSTASGPAPDLGAPRAPGPR